MSESDSISYRRMMLVCVCALLVLVSANLSLNMLALIGILNSPAKRAAEANTNILHAITIELSHELANHTK